MTIHIDENDFLEQILLVSLATCFTGNEEHLTDEQVFVRGFAPTKEYSKACILRLSDKGLVSIMKNHSSGKNILDSEYFKVLSPIPSGQDREDYIYEKSKQIKELLNDSDEYKNQLHELENELLACECVEYCIFYSQKSGLSLKNITEKNAKLKLLILEIDAEQIQMLLWVSIKKNSEIQLKSESINFSCIIDTAFDLYIKYKKLDIEIERYKKPRLLNISTLSALVEFFSKN